MEPGSKLCECGCGVAVNPKRRFVSGHHTRLLSGDEQARRSKGHRLSEAAKENLHAARDAYWVTKRLDLGPLPPCACGCGEPVKKHRNRFLHGHSSRMIDHKVLAARVCGARVGKKHSPEARKKISASKQALFASGYEPWNKGLTKDIHPSVGLHNKGQFQSAADHYDRSFPTTSTTPEAALQIALWKRGIPFLFNVPIRHICRPDFLFPDARIVVQVDGAYWHRGRKDKDAAQDAALQAEGWQVFRWDEEGIRSQLDELLDLLESSYRSRLSCQGGPPEGH